jgi:hypothetical protein
LKGVSLHLHLVTSRRGGALFGTAEINDGPESAKGRAERKSIRSDHIS